LVVIDFLRSWNGGTESSSSEPFPRETYDIDSTEYPVVVVIYKYCSSIPFNNRKSILVHSLGSVHPIEKRFTMAKFSSAALLSLLALMATSPTVSRGFVTRSPSTSKSNLVVSAPLRPTFVSFRGGETELAASTAEVESETVPSWESLESELEELKSKSGEDKKPVLTLYR
jgi:hypothetical protein